MRSPGSLLYPLTGLGAALIAEGFAISTGSPALHFVAAGLGVATVLVAVRPAKNKGSHSGSEPPAWSPTWELAAVLQSNRIGLLRWDADRSQAKPTPECAALFGYPAAQTLDNEQALLAAILYPDREWARERWRQIQQGALVPAQIFAVRGPDGVDRTLRFDVRHPPSGVTGAGPVEVIRDISHRQATSKDFDEGQAYLTHLIRAIPGSVFHLERTADGRFALRFVSDGGGATLLPPGETDNDRFSHFLGTLDGDQRARLLTSLTHSANQMEVWRHDTLLGTKEQPRWLRFHALPSREGSKISWRGMVVDATVEKQVEQELRLTRFAMDHAQDLVSILDGEGRRVYVNQSFLAFTGRSLAEVHSSRVWDSIPAYGEDGYRRLWATVRERGTMVFEVDLLHKNGSLKPIEVNARFLTINGMEVVCTVSRDLGPRRRADRERQLMEQQLRETQKLESLGVLAGGIAHDFNNLLTGILGNASLARDRLDDEDPLHGPLRQVERAAVRAGELCQQMLAYAGKGRVVVGPVDLSQLVEETSHLLHVNIARRAAIEMRLARGLPLVQADATQIRQIVMNLVLNAAEAIDRSGGLVTVTTGVRSVSKEYIQSARVCHGMEPGECVFLEVRDNGTGMDQATLERIFEPFFTTKFTGRGLGLAAVLGIVRSHHGLLHVASAPGEGTTFTLMLSPESRPAPARPAAPATESPHLRRYARVLVIDDEESVRQVAWESLERFGCKVSVADSGDSGLHLLQTSVADPHVVLLDFTMPQRDGVSVLRSLRALRPQLPVIMMSGFSEDETRQRLDGCAIDGFLAKPFTLGQLRDAVESVIKSPPPGTTTLPRT